MRLQSLLPALRSRNLRLFFSGQSVSLIGTWVQQAAMGWLVYRMTGSALLLGVIGFTSQIPSLFLSPVAGVLADRWNLRRILLITQGLALLQAALLALLVLTDTIRVWEIVVLSLFLGSINAFDIPVRQLFVVDLVEKREDLGNAIALNSSMVNAARLIGPSIAGLLVAAVGEGICFLLNSVSYVAVLIPLFIMQVVTLPSGRVRRRLLQELREGFDYAFGFSPIRSILLLIALVSLTGMPYSVLMPVFASAVLHGDARTFGLLMAAAGGGALVGTVYLASRRSAQGLDRVIPITASLFGVGLVAFSFSGTLPVSLVCLGVTGFGAMALVSASNAFLQTLVEDDKRGRVMSLYIMALIGFTPFGSLLAGALAHILGVRNTLLFGGGACIVGGAAFAWNLPKMRSQMRTSTLMFTTTGRTE